MYNRLTPTAANYGEATLEYHISGKETYDRLQELETEIISNKIQNRLTTILPKEQEIKGKIKVKCQWCNSNLPIKYKNFCPNCGSKLR